MPESPKPSSFPLKTALAILIIAVALLLWHRFAPSSMPPGLDWHSLPEVAKLPEFQRKPGPGDNAQHAPEPDLQGSGEGSQLTTPGKPGQGKSPNKIPGPQQPPGSLLIDNAGSLDHFYASLAALEQHKPRAETAVVHFGDSPSHRRPHHRRRPPAAPGTFRRRRPGLQPHRQALGLVRPPRYRRERPRLEVHHRRRFHARRPLRHRRRKLRRLLRAHPR